MSKKIDYEKLSVFEQIKQGLEESLAHSRGELTLRTTTLAAPAPALSKSRVIAIRNSTGMSQSVFASYLNVPTRTLQSWEQGARHPKAGEARLLQLIEAAPQEIFELIADAKQRRARQSNGRKRAAS